MTKEKFLNDLRETLDLGELKIDESTYLNLSSLQHLSIMAFIDENFDKTIKIADLKKVESVGDIIKLIGIERIK